MFVEKKFILCKPKFPKRCKKLRKILNKVREANLPMNQFPEVNPRGVGGGVGWGGVGGWCGGKLTLPIGIFFFSQESQFLALATGVL